MTSLDELSTHLLVSIRKNTFRIGNSGEVSVGQPEILETIVFKEGTIEEQKTRAEDWVVSRLNYWANLNRDIFIDAYLTIRPVDADGNYRHTIECGLVVAGDKTIEWYE
jgi:hypothetical protein